MSILYQTAASAASGRDGVTRLEDDTLSFDLSVPGSGKEGTNPEQLFALGYAACFDSAAKMVAHRLKLPLESSETRASVALKQADDGYRLVVAIGLKTSGLSREQAEQLLATAHQTCPYSRALRGTADVSVSLLEDVSLRMIA